MSGGRYTYLLALRTLSRRGGEIRPVGGEVCTVVPRLPTTPSREALPARQEMSIIRYHTYIQRGYATRAICPWGGLGPSQHISSPGGDLDVGHGPLEDPAHSTDVVLEHDPFVKKVRHKADHSPTGRKADRPLGPSVADRDYPSRARPMSRGRITW